MRRTFVVGLMAVLIAASVDLGACGDKFLRVGRSARFRRYAAVHPATILIYKPANSTPSGIHEFTALLKRAGHRPVAIDRAPGAVPRALAATEYDLVIADYADAEPVQSDIHASSSRAELLPILYKPSKTLEVDAEKQFACLIKPHVMTKYDALAEIDRLMEMRPKGTKAAVRKQ